MACHSASVVRTAEVGACSAVLEAGGRCTVVDCYSLSSRPLPYELGQAPDRADICPMVCLPVSAIAPKVRHQPGRGAVY